MPLPRISSGAMMVAEVRVTLEDGLAYILPAAPPVLATTITLYMIARELRKGLTSFLEWASKWLKMFVPDDGDGFAIPVRLEIVHIHKRHPKDIPPPRRRATKPRLVTPEEEESAEESVVVDVDADESPEPTPTRRR